MSAATRRLAERVWTVGLEGGLSGGGSVIADGGAYVAGPESHTDCFLVSAGEGVFTLPGGGEPEAEYFPGDGAFASAVTVRSYAALRSAAARGESVRVTGNITLEGGVSLRAPLLIEEGAGISGGYTLVSEGAAVVNNGDLGCDLSFEGGSASLLNRGSLTGCVCFAGGDGLLCNLGSIELEGNSSLSCAAVNAGTLTLASGDAFLSHEGGDFFNSGGVFVESGSQLVRAGNSLTVDGAIFCVNGMLCCDDLRVTGGGMAEIIGEWRGLTDESRISVSDGSWVYTRESILPLDEINVDATSMMLYSPASGRAVPADNAAACRR